jgi:hypothetical protein
MRRWRHVVAAIAATLAVLIGPMGRLSGIANAEGRCLFQGDWNCYGPPQYNGPGLNTWDVPGTYGGWTTLPLMCPPGADLQPCQQYIPRP